MKTISVLSEFLVPNVPSRPNLWSGDDNTLLTVLRTKQTFGDKSFTHIAPHLQNSYPSTFASVHPSIHSIRHWRLTLFLPANFFPSHGCFIILVPWCVFDCTYTCSFYCISKLSSCLLIHESVGNIFFV